VVRRDVRVSKFLSLVLRHDPGRIGLTLDPNGWAGIDELLAAATRHGMTLEEDELRTVVADNDKQRFVLDDERRRIRANQGHSIDVDLELVPEPPPDRLYHGTVATALPEIMRHGLLPMARQQVHLSADVDTATRVGRRRGSPVVLVVDGAAMAADGFLFSRSRNGVWLTDTVPPRYLSPPDPGDGR
jgi:putative RNA 2'-phosphotransferase